jgi:hypothetical protein
MLNQATEHEMKNKLIELCSNRLPDRERSKLQNPNVRDEDFQRVKIQLFALGLIMKTKGSGYHWKLTPYGIHRLTQVAAIRAQS